MDVIELNKRLVTQSNYLCSSALDLHGPAIIAWTYPFLTCSTQHLFQIIFSRPVYMHVNCIIEGFVAVKQPPTCTLIYNSEIFLQ